LPFFLTLKRKQHSKQKILKYILMKAHTKETQLEMTPDKALAALKEGNARFQNNQKVTRDLMEQVKDTSGGQYPFATILSCIDSRVSAELIFDQGIGDIFSVRIAGNFTNPDILGSMEFACKLAGTKLIVVLGHTACGAVKGACDSARLGNLSGLIEKIELAVEAVKEPADPALRNSSNSQFVDEVAQKNVQMTIENIRLDSPVLAEMEAEGAIQIVGAMYDIKTGAVHFL
jgi:carbonic anhydrase